MRNVTAIVIAGALASCAGTPCEEEADVRASCPSSTANEESIQRMLPECADHSVDACRANCGLDYEDDLCDILDQAAPSDLVDEYTDCLASCVATST